MSTVVHEVPIVGDLTGSEILRRGGWPSEGVGLELVRALRAEMDAMCEEKWWESPAPLVEARFRRLQVLEGLAHSRRHARQCARLGHPEQGARHTAKVTPAGHAEYATWRAWARGQIDRSTAVEIIGHILNICGASKVDRARRWRDGRWTGVRTIVDTRAACSPHLQARIDRYFADTTAY